MNFNEQNDCTIQQAFLEYHRLNPNLYAEIKRLAFQAINKGKTKISFKLIINVLRWNVFLQTNEPLFTDIEGTPTKFKINDIYGSRYARMFIRDFPEHADKVELRSLRS